ncbi:hypothetical protein BS78_01G028300 [Paspalum vaginatum]|nr:hypothetical protein BS78_01G028300 [Paspalum vaginatum]
MGQGVPSSLPCCNNSSGKDELTFAKKADLDALERRMLDKHNALLLLGKETEKDICLMNVRLNHQDQKIASALDYNRTSQEATQAKHALSMVTFTFGIFAGVFSATRLYQLAKGVPEDEDKAAKVTDKYKTVHGADEKSEDDEKSLSHSDVKNNTSEASLKR